MSRGNWLCLRCFLSGITLVVKRGVDNKHFFCFFVELLYRIFPFCCFLSAYGLFAIYQSYRSFAAGIAGAIFVAVVFCEPPGEICCYTSIEAAVLTANHIHIPRIHCFFVRGLLLFLSYGNGKRELLNFCRISGDTQSKDT